MLLLHGPVGSSKSTIARLLKQGLERYSATDDGALYTLGWVDRRHRRRALVPDARGAAAPDSRAVPRRRAAPSSTPAAAKTTTSVRIVGELCPFCRYMYTERLKKYDGDWTNVDPGRPRQAARSCREKDRIGIGTFQPKDEKNQDSTELTGDINYRKIAEYGSDSDPRAFNFDGEFNVANRGIIEFVEVLKLDVAFLYDLLGASQEHKVKPKKFAQTDIDEVIIGHTNEPEYRRLQNNEFMEALRDRTVKIDVPYVTQAGGRDQDLREGLQHGEGEGQAHRPAHDRNGRHVGHAHAAGRAEERQPDAAAEAQALQRQDAAGLHRRQHQGAARAGHQRRACTASRPATCRTRSPTPWWPIPDATSINPFMVLNELEAGLKHHSLITSEELRSHYRELLGVVKEEYENIVKNEVQRAIAADEDALKRLCGNYIDNVKAYTQREKVTQQVHRPVRRAGRAADAVDRGEDRHSRQPQGRLPPRDHELHRRPGDRRQDVRLQDERAAVQGPGAEAVRGPEGHDQADQPGVATSSTTTRRPRSTWSRAA